jgi:hypothetical protein
MLLCCLALACRCEIPLTGCTHDKTSRIKPWVCPTNRTGFLRSDPVTKWAGFMRSKVSFTLRSLA